MKMYPPGKMYHFMKTHSESSCCSSHDRYIPIQVDVDYFPKMVVSPIMVRDHMPFYVKDVIVATVSRLKSGMLDSYFTEGPLVDTLSTFSQAVEEPWLAHSSQREMSPRDSGPHVPAALLSDPSHHPHDIDVPRDQWMCAHCTHRDNTWVHDTWCRQCGKERNVLKVVGWLPSDKYPPKTQPITPSAMIWL